MQKNKGHRRLDFVNKGVTEVRLVFQNKEVPPVHQTPVGTTCTVFTGGSENSGKFSCGLAAVASLSTAAGGP